MCCSAWRWTTDLWSVRPGLGPAHCSLSLLPPAPAPGDQPRLALLPGLAPAAAAAGGGAGGRGAAVSAAATRRSPRPSKTEGSCDSGKSVAVSAVARPAPPARPPHCTALYGAVLVSSIATGNLSLQLATCAPAHHATSSPHCLPNCRSSSRSENVRCVSAECQLN